MSYNLLDEKWIPVLYRDGRWERVGIRRALENAGQIRQIAANNPMDRIAIVRFLLALLYWCKGNPVENAGDDRGNSFPAGWFAKLDDNRACFNLLGEAPRFYQDSEAHRSRAATDLLQEIPTGNNFWHFRHSTDEMDGLCPACCATGLLRLPMFSVSGLPDLKAGINGTPPVYAVPWGASLYATLAANWTHYPTLGDPVWVHPYVPSPADERVPLLAGLTMLSRRVWLHAPEPNGTCIGCGSQKTAIIRTCEFQTAGRQENVLWTDPHIVYLDRTPRKPVKAPDLSAAGRFKMDRPWPDLIVRMAEIGRFETRGETASFLVVGFATDKAKNIDVWERSITIKSGTVVQEAGLSCLMQWQKEASRLVRRCYRPSAKKSSRKYVQVSSLLAAIRPDIEDRVSARAGELVAADAEVWQQAGDQYHLMMGVIAQSVSPGFTTAAVRWRRQIAGVSPDVRPKTEMPEKPEREKGAN